jgi:hypothetical protein
LPATKEGLIDYAIRSEAPILVLENLQELEEEDIFRVWKTSGPVFLVRKTSCSMKMNIKGSSSLLSKGAYRAFLTFT